MNDAKYFYSELERICSSVQDLKGVVYRTIGGFDIMSLHRDSVDEDDLKVCSDFMARVISFGPSYLSFYYFDGNRMCVDADQDDIFELYYGIRKNTLLEVLNESIGIIVPINNSLIHDMKNSIKDAVIRLESTVYHAAVDLQKAISPFGFQVKRKLDGTLYLDIAE